MIDVQVLKFALGCRENKHITAASTIATPTAAPSISTVAPRTAGSRRTYTALADEKILKNNLADRIRTCSAGATPAPVLPISAALPVHTRHVDRNASLANDMPEQQHYSRSSSTIDATVAGFSVISATAGLAGFSGRNAVWRLTTWRERALTRWLDPDNAHVA
ncbi:MAG: hypothetical protein EOS55_05485 [Mesorhizobium sp.]|nr:MAG: hypothetical protein EOS55_05485 [Mesorhizobium sp.]